MSLLLPLLATVVALLVFGFMLYYFNRRFYKRSLIKGATKEGAKETLDRLADWAKWMSGIQTALLGAVGFVIHDCQPLWLAIPTCVTVLITGCALFCSAWVLSALPSIAIRLSAFEPNTQEEDGRYDVYEQPLYGITFLPLSFMTSLQHWLWGGSLISFGWLLVSMAAGK